MCRGRQFLIWKKVKTPPGTREKVRKTIEDHSLTEYRRESLRNKTCSKKEVPRDVSIESTMALALLPIQVFSGD